VETFEAAGAVIDLAGIGMALTTVRMILREIRVLLAHSEEEEGIGPKALQETMTGGIPSLRAHCEGHETSRHLPLGQIRQSEGRMDLTKTNLGEISDLNLANLLHIRDHHLSHRYLQYSTLENRPPMHPMVHTLHLTRIL
jgi:hypothetical protein